MHSRVARWAHNPDIFCYHFSLFVIPPSFLLPFHTSSAIISSPVTRPLSPLFHYPIVAVNFLSVSRAALLLLTSTKITTITINITTAAYLVKQQKSARGYDPQLLGASKQGTRDHRTISLISTHFLQIIHFKLPLLLFLSHLLA